MKKTVTVLAAALLIATIFQPAQGQAKSLSEVNREINKLDSQSQSFKKQQQQAEADKEEAEHYKNKTIKTLEIVLQQIEDVSNQLARVALDIENTEESLRQTKKELEEATNRISAREKTLETRVRLMYTDGTVSYLDVLLSSTNFNDFITRVDSIKTIVDQDQFLLDEHKKDKALVVSKKQQLDSEYAYAKSLYEIKQNARKELDAKEQEKQRLIAGYDDQIIAAGDISDEANEMLVQLASKRSTLIQQQNKLKAEQAARAAAARKAAAKRSASTAPASFSGGSGIMGMPIGSYRMSSGYGPRTHPITGVRGKMHTGIDMAAPQGSAIYAAEDGVVILAEWWSGYGNTVIIDHGDGLWTLYGHIRSGGIKVSNGQTVKRGQKIAEVGSTGNSTGPHLHFEVRENNVPVNPNKYL
ncbi:murein hydrolase activator EnvC family protein [Paenibacillus massiliensis]|uniref:murein hydrolase activator EnvC family protein n=1 Tax=Paenibacillus massiliensis TaxID=225917 RepID=UPI00037EE451|nr:M23 family metallopeptidase [Paenibacillus massiliensis]